MGMEGAGRLFNPAAIAAGTLLSVKDCAGYTFVLTGNDTFTLKSAGSYNGSPTALPVITSYWTNTSTGGGAQWVAQSQAAASTIVIASGAAMVYVDAAELPSGAEYLEVSVAAGGLVTAIPHDLLVQRSPDMLRPLSGSGS
jgi:hypothetical protein